VDRLLPRHEIGPDARIVGREPELAAVGAFLRSDAGQPAALVIEGRDPCRKLTDPIDGVKPEQLFASLGMPEAIDRFVNRYRITASGC